MRICLTPIFYLFPIFCFSQIDFKNLSAEQIIKIGQEELEEASKDSVFVFYMDNGHMFFKEKKYEEAIENYKKAERQRPQNVYPKVIIRDIELERLNQQKQAQIEAQREEEQRKRNAELMAQQLERRQQLLNRQQNNNVEVSKDSEPVLINENIEKESTLQIEEETITSGSNSAKEEVDLNAIVTESLDPDVIEVEEKVEDKPSEEIIKELPKREEGKKVSVVKSVQPKPEIKTEEIVLEDGFFEEEIDQGNKTILRRTLIVNGKKDVFEEVTHVWGGVFWFKNGKSITEQEFAKDSKPVK
jgi:tetratricopeptide (TPR) repeat protein